MVEDTFAREQYRPSIADLCHVMRKKIAQTSLRRDCEMSQPVRTLLDEMVSLIEEVAHRSKS